MNVLTILYFIFLAPPVELPKDNNNNQPLTATKITKPAKKDIEESSVYYLAPTKWVKNK